MIEHLWDVKSKGQNMLGGQDHALFVPAISTYYVVTLSDYIYRGKQCRMDSLYKDGAKALNYLDPEHALFYYPATLYSAGHAEWRLDKAKDKEGIILQRDRKTSWVIGDSGGYQIAGGILGFDFKKGMKHPDNDKTREDVLRWLENHCDVAMTLDVPSRAMRIPRVPKDIIRLADQGGFNDCLEWSLVNLDYFRDNRKNPDLKLLNVLQGEDQVQSNTWWEAVKDYPFEGWAFAGSQQRFMDVALSRIIKMRDEGYLGKCKDGKERLWIHFLGQTKLEAGIVFTEIQRKLRETIDPRITISYDSANSFLAVSKGQIYTTINFDQGASDKKFSYKMERGIDHPSLKHPDVQAKLKDIPFPWKNVVTENLSLADICYYTKTDRPTTWDLSSYAMLMAHNLVLQMEGLQRAQRIFDVGKECIKQGAPNVVEQWVPRELLDFPAILDEIFASKDPYQVIANHRPYLQGLLGRQLTPSAWSVIDDEHEKDLEDMYGESNDLKLAKEKKIKHPDGVVPDNPDLF